MKLKGIHFFSSGVLVLSAGALLMTLATACGNEKEKVRGRDEKFDQVVVVNELMASNQTGLLTEDGLTADWIEIKNVSSEDVSLKDYALEYEKAPADTTAAARPGKKKKAGKNAGADSVRVWRFPAVSLKPGQCAVIFASKADSAVTGKEMHANFKLSAGGGTVRLLAGTTRIMSEVSYGKMNPDEAYRRTPDNKMERSYEATPGLDNSEAGYEAYNELMEKQRTGAVKIWRVMSKAGRTGVNWAEVKNVSGQAVDLSEYALTDKPKKPLKWQFPAVQLQPGATYRVQFAGKKTPAGDARKVNFKIGEELLILTHKGKFADGLNGTCSLRGTTMGREEGRKGFFYFKSDGKVTRGYRHIAAAPTFLSRPGVYASEKSLCVRLDGHGRKVRYTTGLKIPTGGSPLFADSVRIGSSTTFHAYAEGDSNTLSSAVATASYLLGQEHKVAVVNITMDEADLFDFNRGIYVDGPNPAPEIPHLGANYWKGWEKRAHVEFYDGKEGFSEGCVVKVFGGYSRILAKKSLTVKFNGKYGPSSITYDLFGRGRAEEYKSFVLRAGGQDAEGLMGRDEFFTSLMGKDNPHLMVQDYRPVAVYVNNKYFGLFFIREKINKNFIERHMGIKADNVTMFMSKYLEMGNGAEYRQLMKYLQSHDMTQKEHLEYAARHIDFESLIDFKLGEIYSQNTDIGNSRYFRSTDKGSDGKWHWIYYDVDCGFRDERNAAYYIGLGHDELIEYENMCIAQLLKNREFRELFLQRLSHHMHHTFTAENTTRMFDALMAGIDEEMVLNCQRWGNMLSYKSWKKYQKTFRQKLLTRNKAMLDDLRQFLKITPEEDKKYFGDL